MYKVDFTRKAFKNLSKIPRKYQELILEKIDRLSEAPFNTQNVKNLKGENDFYRLRVGTYRVIFQILEKKVVILLI